MAKFELISQYQDHPELLPQRSTISSAGYDFFVADNIILRPYETAMDILYKEYVDTFKPTNRSITLEEMAALTKSSKAKPTLVPTGIKCQLENNQYLKLVVRSSTPLKHWIILANAEGIIDADYYNNPDNEGHIFFQVINLSPIFIKLKPGDRIGQGIICNYNVVDDDNAVAQRLGGLGST